jgi:hypothetical protein
MPNIPNDAPFFTASQYDMVQTAAARRQQGASIDLPPPDVLAQQIAAHALRMGDARSAYAYLDDLTREVGLALKAKGL